MNNLISLLIFLYACYFGYRYFELKDYRGLMALSAVSAIFMLLSCLGWLALQRFFVIYLENIKDKKYEMVIKILFIFVFLFLFLYLILVKISNSIIICGLVIILFLVSLITICILSLIQ